MNDTGKRKIIIGILIVTMLVFPGCGRKEVTLVEADESQESEVETGQILNEGAYTLKSGQEVSEVVISDDEKADNEENVTAESQMDKTETVSSKSRKIYVHVCGAVEKPGVYQLDEDARVYEAVEKAGGFLEEAYEEALNQAQLLQDGEQVFIPTKDQWEHWQETGQNIQTMQSNSNGQAGQVAINGQATGNEVTWADGLININTATKEELCTLPGVGESKAESIIAYRVERGSFSSIEEIKNVTGIKDGLFQKIKDKIKVK